MYFLVLRQTSFVVDTKNKLSFVYKIVSKFNDVEEDNELNIKVVRGKELESTIQNFKKHKIEDLISRPFYTQFQNEKGADQGGVTQDYLTNLIHQIVDERKGLMKLTFKNKSLYPSRISEIIPDHKTIFLIFGLLAGNVLIFHYTIKIDPHQQLRARVQFRHFLPETSFK